MKVVIDIPEIDYVLAHIKDYSSIYTDRHIVEAIANGTPIDLEGLKSDIKALKCGYPYGLDYLLNCLKKRLGITIDEVQDDK